MYDALRFWLDRGVDGFRVDVMWHLIKDAELRDNPPNPAYVEGRPEIERFLQMHSADQPEVHEVVSEMRRVINSYPDRVLIGEIYLPQQRLMTYYGKDGDGAQLPFNFQMIFASWNARSLTSMIADYEGAIPEGGWPNWVLGNHDQHRLATRIGQPQAPLAAMLLLTLRGTPTIYYGEEIGMTDVVIPYDRVQDPWERHEPGLGFGRDPERTPMQWDAGPSAGFTTGEPWLPVAPDYQTRNVAREKTDENSILSLYRSLIELRRQYSALSVGDFRLLGKFPDHIAFERSDRHARLHIYLNFSTEPIHHPWSDDTPPGRMLLSTLRDHERQTGDAGLALEVGEGVVLLVEGNAG